MVTVLTMAMFTLITIITKLTHIDRYGQPYMHSFHTLCTENA